MRPLRLRASSMMKCIGTEAPEFVELAHVDDVDAAGLQEVAFRRPKPSLLALPGERVCGNISSSVEFDWRIYS